MAALAVTRRLDLTDEQWARLEPLLPVPTRSGRPPAWTKRQLIDGIRWRVRVGAPWRDVPDCYGSWRAVSKLEQRIRPPGQAPVELSPEPGQVPPASATPMSCTLIN